MKNILKKIVIGVLGLEARAVLAWHKPTVIAITGSVGKTSTKDAIYELLRDEYRTRRSEKSFNSEIGVPLTILNLDNAWSNPVGWTKNLASGLGQLFSRSYPQVLVLEVGVGIPGDMDRITKFLKPDIVVVTRFAKTPVHVEHFGSAKAVWQEKGKLVSALKNDGTVVLCGDDSQVLSMRELTEAVHTTFGFDERGNRFLGSNPEIFYERRLSGLEFPAGIVFRVDVDGRSVPVRMHGTLGRQHMYSALAALSVAEIMGMNLVEAASRFPSYTPPPGRMRVLEGIKNSTIVDDSYNSSPVAATALCETMGALEIDGRKIAVLGDMLELGRFWRREHKKVGAHAAEVLDVLVTVGARAREIATGALEAGMSEKNILQFDDAHQAGLFLQNMIAKGDVIAVKGSQGSGEDLIRTERAVVEIMAHPEKREHLLVRQEGAWRE